MGDKGHYGVDYGDLTGENQNLMKAYGTSNRNPVKASKRLWSYQVEWML